MMTMSIRRSSLLVFHVLVASLPIASGNPLYAEREWTGKNGSNLRAKYVGKVEGGAKVEIRDPSGKIHRIGLENLSEADREFIKAGETGKLPKGAEQAVTEAMKMFRPTPEMDRSKIPLIAEIGDPDNHTVVEAFAPFLLWWDQEKFLPLSEGGDLESKAAWLYPRMARHFNTREEIGSGIKSLTNGWRRYFKAEADDLAIYRFGSSTNLSPEMLSEMAKGADATVLTMTLVQGSERYGHAVTLLSAEPDGKVMFGCWGERFEGKIELLPAKDPSAPDTNRSPRNSYSFRFDDWGLAKVKAPEWIANNPPQFILEYPDARLLVLRPFVFAEPGKPAPPPDVPW